MTWTRLFLLGPPRFERDGRVVQPPSAKAAALLAYLAVTGAPQPRERVMDLLWTESLEEAARKNLRNTLWAIRRSLGEDVVRAGQDRLTLGEGVWVDVAAFERPARGGRGAPVLDVPAREAESVRSVIDELRAAAELYRGPLLDDLVLAEASEFEVWLTAQRERLAEANARTLTMLVDAYRAAGDWSEVIETARRALAFDPLREAMHRALIEAHARRGERAEALRQFDALRETLARELGVEPLAETLALRDAVTSGALGPAAAPVASPAAPPRRPSVPGGPPRAPLVGRGAELDALDAEWRAAKEGQVRVILLAGELGIGKSRLWREWSAEPRAGTVVLEGRCLEATQALPWAPVVELLGGPNARRLFAAPSPLAPIWLAEVARLLPEIRLARPDLPLPPALPVEEERRRVFEALAQALLALDGRPLVLFLDDLHWSDRVTLDWLDFLVHRLRDCPLLLVAAYRPADAPARLMQLIAGWERAEVARRVAPQRLSPAESAELVASLGGDPALAERAHALSAGNPYFLIELTRQADGEPDGRPPAALADLLGERLARLPEAARQVLQAAAVLEPDFEFGALRRTAGRGEEETLDALDVLLGADVLVERGREYAFAHPLVASVVRGGLSGTRRAFLHRRAAEALELTHAGRVPQVAARLAGHLREAGDPVRAAAFAQMAAERALTQAALAEAVAFYREAVALDPTPARSVALARTLYFQGDIAAAREVAVALVSEAATWGDRPGDARALLDVAEMHLGLGQPVEALRWAERGLARLGDDPDPEPRAVAHFLLGSARSIAGGSLPEAEADLAEARRLATEHGLPGLAGRVRFGLGNLSAQRGELDEARRAFEDSVVLARAAGEVFQEILSHNNAGYHALLAGDLVGARGHVDAGLTLTEERGLSLPLGWLFSTRGEIALAEGQWDEARRWFERGLAQVEPYGHLALMANYRANLGLAARGSGDLDGALAHLTAARDALSGLLDPHLQIRVDLWLAELHLAREERTAAVDALRRAEARLTGTPYAGLRAWAGRVRQAVAAT